MNLHLTPEMPDVCLSFLLLLTIFIIVVTQKLVLQQRVRKPYRPLLLFNSPWVKLYRGILLYNKALRSNTLYMYISEYKCMLALADQTGMADNI